MKIIFSGSIGRLPYGGHAWVDMQNLAGLSVLGHEVYYLEECGDESWVYDWERCELTNDLSYPASYVRSCLETLGLGDKWIYRAGDSAEGMPVAQFVEICAEADLLLIRAVPLPVWRPEYSLPRRRAFIDADPGFTQISLVNGHADLTATVERCHWLFTIGQRIGASDCPIPTAGKEWVKTLPPVSLPHWPVVEDVDGAPTHFTSIMHWRGFREVEHQDVIYGQKDREFPRFIHLPTLTDQRFKVALTGGDEEWFRRCGWEVEEGWIASRTPALYQGFIQESRAEFGVAKHGYVLMRGGWFSDRSVCYLASGRPVLVQDTGLPDWLPVGEGVLTFSDVPGALAGVDAINADYERHRRAARRLAEQFFDAERVLPPLIDAAMG
ncbi:MAG TPA: glycosyltransferase family 1 protein [Chloroflexia bacterium]|nr:glycosyltransferase family 1 protein [Chloroflexia bacterium]